MIIAWLIIQTLENFHDYATLRRPINLGCSLKSKMLRKGSIRSSKKITINYEETALAKTKQNDFLLIFPKKLLIFFVEKFCAYLLIIKKWLNRTSH